MAHDDNFPEASVAGNGKFAAASLGDDLMKNLDIDCGLTDSTWVRMVGQTVADSID